MLRTNLWTAGGLINGTLGYVREIIYSNNDSPPQLPKAIMVEFDSYPENVKNEINSTYFSKLNAVKIKIIPIAVFFQVKYHIFEVFSFYSTFKFLYSYQIKFKTVLYFIKYIFEITFFTLDH